MRRDPVPVWCPSVVPPLSTNRPAPQHGGSVRFRTPEPSDGRALWALAKRSGLDLNPPYAYVMWGHYHAAPRVVATPHDAVVRYIPGLRVPDAPCRSEEHTSELQSRQRTSTAVFCLK